ncbi:MAG: hypothetical protein H0V23_14155, partial [Nocardioidaceae bacterium]|nr:hypothetical protein [Nocardioidaceae bacterium]
MIAEYVVTVAVSLTVALALADRSPIALMMALGISLALLLEFVTLPIYDRCRSMRPLRRSLTLAGAVLLTGTAFGWLQTSDVRTGLM